MGFAIQDTDLATANTADPMTLTMDVAAGDLIVVGSGNPTDTGFTLSGVTDEDDNTYTLTTTRAAGSQVLCRMAYAIAAKTNSTLTITFAFDAGTFRKNVYAAVFRPDAGDTVAYDTEAYKQSGYEASPNETAAFSTTGNDEVCIAIFQGGAATFSNQEIPSGSAATVVGSQVYSTFFYTFFTSTQSSIIAETDASTSQYYVCQLLAFKAEVSNVSIDVPADLQAGYGQLPALEVIEGGHWIEHKAMTLIF